MTQFFVIAFVGRTGSSYLEALIDSHPDAQCLGEILTWDAFPADQAGTEAALNQLVHSVTLAASGFKLPMGSAAQPPEILRILYKYRYKVLHIVRRDKLDQYLSMKLAIENNAWRSDYGRYQTDKLRLEPEHAIRAISEFIAMDDYIAARTRPFPYRRIVYEDVLARPDIPAVLDFLGLKRHPLISKYDRQRSLSQRDSIKNYDEIVSALLKAGLGSHLMPV